MVDFPSYTDDECVQLARDYLAFEAGEFGVTLDLDAGSDADMTARLLGALLAMSQRQAQAVMTAASPVKAFGAFLREHATSYGIGPSVDRVGVDALKASGYAIVVCTTGSTTIAAGLTLRAPDGQTYVTTGSATAPASATGNALIGWLYGSSLRRFILGSGDGTLTNTITPAINDVLAAVPSGELCAVSEAVGAAEGAQHNRFELYSDLDALPLRFTRALAVCVPIEAVTAGRAGNRDQKAALVVQSPPAGVSTSAYVVYCDGGRDAMTPAEIRTALRDLFATRQTQAKSSELRDMAIATPRAFIDDCVVQPGYFGVGSYVLRPLSSFGRTTSSWRGNSVQARVQSMVPPGLNIQSRAVFEIAANMTTIDVDCAAGYGPDFKIAQTTGYHLATIKDVTGMASTQLLFSGVTDVASLPRIGDRVIVSMWTTVATVDAQKRAFALQARVTASSFVSAGTYLITVDKPLCYYNIPAVVTAGGPLGEAVIDAIIASHNSRLPTAADVVPFVSYPELDATTNQGALTRALSRIQGVTDVHVSADATYTMTGGQVWALGPMTIRMHAG